MTYPLPGSFEEKARQISQLCEGGPVALEVGRALDDLRAIHNDIDCMRRSAAVALDAEERVRGTRERDIGELRRRIAELLHRFEKLPEQVQWQYHYDEALQTLDEFGLTYGGVPSLNQVLTSFSQEKRDAVPQLSESYFLLVPDNDFETKIKALDAKDCFGKKTDNRLPPSRESQPEKITAWRGIFIEAATEMQNAPASIIPVTEEDWRIKTPLAERLQKRDEQLSDLPFEGVTRDYYALLIMHAARKGRRIDQKYSTIFDGEPITRQRVRLRSEYHIPQGCFHRGGPLFMEADVHGWNGYSGFRRVVAGEKIEC